MKDRLCRSIGAAALIVLFVATTSYAAVSTRTPPGFHHGRKAGWHGLHHPPGGRTVARSAGTTERRLPDCEGDRAGESGSCTSTGTERRASDEGDEEELVVVGRPVSGSLT